MDPLERFRGVGGAYRRLSRSPIGGVLALVAGVLALGHALQISNGFYKPAALSWLSAAVVFCLGGILWASPSESGVGRDVPRPPPHAGWAADSMSAGSSPWPAALDSTPLVLRMAMTAGLTWQLVELLTAFPGMYQQPEVSLLPFRCGIAAAGVLIGAGAADLRPLRRLWFPALLLVHLLLGAWMFSASPSPHIDVVVVHQEAIRALMRGRDPYHITFENIYGSDTTLYNPEDVVGGRVAFGYPYPPLSLLLALPGQVVLGDHRYSELGALVVAAALIGYTRKGLTAKLAGALLLTTPRTFFVLEQGWTEPLAVLMLAATVFCLTRKPGAASWVSGLLMATKQYLALAAPPLVRVAAADRAGPVRFVLKAAVAAAAVTLPFALWHPHAFIRDVVWLQAREPFRLDSLSYLVWAARAGWSVRWPFAWSLGAGMLVMGGAMVWTPNTPSGFAGVVALASLASFALGSKAFCNYYFFVIGALCCAIAASPLLDEADAAGDSA